MPNPVRLDSLRLDPISHLACFQGLMESARETLPQATSSIARVALERAAGWIGSELIENKGVAPIFGLLPAGGAEPRLTLFATWHAETLPVTPAAVEGAERLALAITLGAVAGAMEAGGLERGSVAVVVAPGSAHGSLVLDPFLREHRARIAAREGFWLRVAAAAPRRRRIYMGGRGRVVIGIWGGEASPYIVRDQVVDRLHEEGYGPRPLDFELVRKLAGSREALEFLEETIEDPSAATDDGETRLKRALFEPFGQVIRPGASHPDRPSAWLSIEIAEGMEPPRILALAREAAAGSRVEMAEALPWDRIGIHHPAIQTLIQLSKSRSAGPELWPMSPWVTPSGVFTRALGTPLAEWGIPLPPGNAVRFPKPEAFAAMELEAAELLLRATGSLAEPEPSPGAPKESAPSAADGGTDPK